MKPQRTYLPKRTRILTLELRCAPPYCIAAQYLFSGLSVAVKLHTFLERLFAPLLLLSALRGWLDTRFPRTRVGVDQFKILYNPQNLYCIKIMYQKCKAALKVRGLYPNFRSKKTAQL
jgi:hypothetical protein